MGKPRVNKNKCVACMECIDSCPAGAIVLSNKSCKAFIIEHKCIDCGSCIEICPVNAIKRKGK